MNARPRSIRGRIPTLARGLPLLLCALLAACTVGPVTLFGPSVQTVTLVTVLPHAGADALLAQAMERAVDLAVRQNAVPAKGYQLTVRHLDEGDPALAKTIGALATDTSVVGVVGPWQSATAAALLPELERMHLATISPGATLPSLTLPGAPGSKGLSYSDLHPKGAALAFFRLASPDTAAGATAAALALASSDAHGLGAHTVFVVSDGSPSGTAQAAAFTSALTSAGGTSAGTATLDPAAADAAQAAAIAIIRAQPDAVFYAGDTQAGAALRRALTLTGAPQLTILTTGAIAANPGWSADVGLPAAAAYTLALLPAQVPSESAFATFASAYRTIYGEQTPPPQAALAYDAAGDEIAAIKALIAAGKPVTRDAVLARVASTPYTGVTGTLAFDTHGDLRTPPGFSLFACDSSGVWQYVAGGSDLH